MEIKVVKCDIRTCQKEIQNSKVFKRIFNDLEYDLCEECAQKIDKFTKEFLLNGRVKQQLTQPTWPIYAPYTDPNQQPLTGTGITWTDNTVGSGFTLSPDGTIPTNEYRESLVEHDYNAPSSVWHTAAIRPRVDVQMTDATRLTFTNGRARPNEQQIRPRVDVQIDPQQEIRQLTETIQESLGRYLGQPMTPHTLSLMYATARNIAETTRAVNDIAVDLTLKL